jgi:SAM-dependent methyltransferase
MRTRDVLGEWLRGLPRRDGVTFASEPRFFGGADGHEDEYANQFVVDETYESSLREGLDHVLREAGVARQGAALEIGCGTGILSRALITQGFATLVVSDMSPVFVRATSRTLPSTGSPVECLVLDTDDIASVPPGSVSLVALRYVLHHVLDWHGFLAASARLLRPGGAILLEEPCSDGYLLQAMLVAAAMRSGADLSADARRELKVFYDTTLWYLNTGVDKSASEDKHLFRDRELMMLLSQLGLEPSIYPNRGLDSATGELDSGYFLREFRHNLAVNFGFGADTLEVFDEHIAPVCEHLTRLADGNMGPLVKAVFVARRPEIPRPRARLGRLVRRHPTTARIARRVKRSLR